MTAFQATGAEEAWIEAYTRLYLEPHRDTLVRLHLAPKGFATIEAALERLRLLGRIPYRPMVDSLAGRLDFEEMLPATVTELMALLNSPEPDIPIYVIVGLHCTNIYSVSQHGETATVLCLEAVDADPAGVRLLLAHEAHHWARQAVHGRDILTGSVGERLVTEGLAIAFSRHAQPGLAEWDYCFVPETTFRWVLAHHSALRALIEQRLDDNCLMDALFARTPLALPLPGMPPRTGYVYGYSEACKMAGEGVTDFGVGLSWRDMLTAQR